MSAKPNAPASAASRRPMSPFMIGPYYKPQLTSMLSIIHRLTGVALTVGTILLAAWLMAAASGEYPYSQFVYVMKSWAGQFLMLCWSWALMFHLCNGIRHLSWDTGYGLDMKTVYITGYLTIAASIVLTAAAWLLAYFVV